MGAMPTEDKYRAVGAALKFIGTQMQPADLVAILEYSRGTVHVRQDFTADRERLQLTIQKIVLAEELGSDATADADNASDTGSAFGQDDSEFNLFNTDRQMAALQTAARMLGGLTEKKALVYFSSGLRLNGVDNQAQLQATVNAALRANVSFYPVDARGLVAEAPLGDASRGSAGGLTMYNGAGAMALSGGFQRSQDTLYSLAADTGGKALFDSNDLSRGIVQAQQALSSYYVLGYYTTNTTLDGKFRRVKIALAADPHPNLEAKLDYRQGYYAAKTFGAFTAAEKERQLEDALLLGDPITELTIAMEVNYFQLNRAEYFVPVSVKIPGRELALARRKGASRTLIDFIGEVKDEYGATIQNVRDKVDIKLSGETAVELARHPIQYDTGFTLLPGTYSIKFLARDNETGRIGTYLHKFVVPNLNKVQDRVPISSVVLSSQQVDLDDALYNAGKAREQAASLAANPLVESGRKLVPSVTRVFSRSRPMEVYLQAYEPSAETARPVMAFLTFYRGDAKAFEMPMMAAKQAMANRLKTVPIRFSVSLDGLEAGRYTCRLTVLDPQGRQANFWQAPVMIAP